MLWPEIQAQPPPPQLSRIAATAGTAAADDLTETGPGQGGETKKTLFKEKQRPFATAFGKKLCPEIDRVFRLAAISRMAVTAHRFIKNDCAFPA